MSFSEEMIEMYDERRRPQSTDERKILLLAEIAHTLEQQKNVTVQENSVTVNELAGVLFRAGVSSSRQVAMHLLTLFAIQGRK